MFDLQPRVVNAPRAAERELFKRPGRAAQLAPAA
jgi:hypothetical protein